MHQLLQEDIPLAPLTTMKVGGPAKRFADVTSEEELLEALHLARENDWPIFILSGGSNVIFSDDGFEGLVIKNNINFFEINGTKITAGAATDMSKLVDESIAAGLAGLEWAGGLPGTLGGAIRGNAGAFGSEIKNTVLAVKSIEIETGKNLERTGEDCKFAYRESIFKQKKEVIVSATLQLKQGNTEELRKAADDHIEYRKEKHPVELPCSGSFFKNTPLDKVPTSELPTFEQAIKTDPMPVVPTAYIIAQAGLSGLQIGQAQVSPKHTNYIVNLGSAKSSDIIELVDKVKEEVKNKFKIELELEPEIVPSHKPTE